MKMVKGLPKRKTSSDLIGKMTVTAMLSAITALLVFTPIGMIPLPPPLPSVTMVHLPVLVAALVEGPLVGAGVGLVFGVCSCIRAWGMGMAGLTLFFRNPLISVLPRILFPLAAAGFYWLWKRIVRRGSVRDKIGAGLSAALGAACNTVLCLGLIVVLYGNDLTQLIQTMISAGNAEARYFDHAGAWLVAVVGLPNGIAEAAVAAVVVPMITVAVEAVAKRTPRRKKTA